MSVINDLANSSISFDESKIKKFFDAPIFITWREALDKYQDMWVLADDTLKHEDMLAIVAIPENVSKRDNDNIRSYGRYMMRVYPDKYRLCSFVIPE